MFLLRELCANFTETRQMIGFNFEQKKNFSFSAGPVNAYPAWPWPFGF